MDPTAAPPPLISATTVLSLLLTVVLLAASYALSLRVLDKDATKTTRFIYIWHLFDFLIHTVFEGSFLWYSFATSTATPPTVTPTLWGSATHTYGAAYGTAPLAQLWQEYARADRRWGEADVGVLSLELLTVLGGGPLALWIAELVRTGAPQRWFWITVLATAELYGGWMTFCPEWLSGNANLETGNPLYLWVYLVFFNTLWVWIPLWLLWASYGALVPALEMESVVGRYSSAKERAEMREGVRFVVDDGRERRGSFLDGIEMPGFGARRRRESKAGKAL